MLNFYTGNGKTLKIMLLFLNQLAISLPLLSSSSWTNTPSGCNQLCCHLGWGRGDFPFHLQTPGQAGAGGNTQEGKAERDTGRACPPWPPSLWGDRESSSLPWSWIKLQTLLSWQAQNQDGESWKDLYSVHLCCASRLTCWHDHWGLLHPFLTGSFKCLSSICGPQVDF